MDAVRKNLLEETFERIINVGLCIVPYEDLSDIASPELMLFGTTKDEKVFSFSELDAMFKSQYEQMAGFVPSLDRKRLFTRTSNDGNNAFITEEVTLTISSPEEVNTIFIRCSCVMEYVDNQWKLTHWHASTPVDTENDHWHMEEWKRENKKLQKLVDQQTADLQGKNRELKIEAALERIRAQATAMQESSDLLDIVVTMRTEFVKLGHEAHYFWHMRWLPEMYEKAMTSGDGTRIGMVMTLPRHIHGDIEPVAEWEKSNDPTYVLAMETDMAVDYVDKMISLGDFEQLDPQAPSLDDVRQIGGLTFIMARTTHGEIGFSLPGVVPDPPKNAVDTLVRFAGVFDLAYKRFEDLKSAERQHREAQIELALERVRARTMAMHNSEELGEVAAVMFEQISSLTSTPDRFNICIANKEDKSFDVFVTDQSGFKIKNTFNAKAKNSPVIAECFETWKNDAAHLIQDIHGKELENWIRYMGKVVGIPFKMENVKKHRFLSSVFFSHGFIGITTHSQPQETTINLIERFAKVFQQTYTRFLDLKKAEAQARESEIQLALERVRARSMAMHKSDELADLSLELVKQVQALGIDTWFCAFNIYDDHPEGSIEWGSNGQGTFPRYRTPREGVFLDYYEAGQRGETLLINEIEEGQCPAHYDYLCSLPGVGDQLLKMKEDGIPFPNSQIDHVAFFKYGYIIFITFEPVPKAHDIFKRFAKVFQQTYTRFLDLQKAEEQTREAQINLAVERVRARALAMFKSEEILEVVYKLKEEIMGLDIPNVTAATIHLKEPDGKYRAWDLTSISEDENELEISLDIRWHREDTHPDFFMREVWDRTEDYFVVIQGGDRYKHTVDWLHQNGHSDYAEEFEEFLESSQLDKAYHPTVPLNNGRMCIDLLDPPSPEIESILKKMAGAFDLAYKRFEDLQKAEEQAKEAQIEAALERVRSRSMGMHKSDDLIEVVREIGKGIHELGIQLHYSQIYTDYTFDPKTRLNIWVDVEGQDYLEKFHIPYIDHSITSAYYDALNEGLDYFSDRYSKAEKDSYFKLLFKYSDLKRIPKKRKELIFNASGWTRFTVILNEATLNFGRYSLDEFTDEEHEIFIRFAKVFGQAYTRFLDLQKAEEQAKEAQVEAALERVRAQAMAMHHTEDLGNTIEVYFEQLDSLIDSIIVRCGAGLLNKENTIAEMSTASRSADGEVYSVNGVIDMRGHPLLDSTYEHWLMQKEHSYVLRGNEIREYYQYITNQVAVPKNAGTDELHFHFPMFTEGSFYVVTERKLPDDELNIFRRFSSVLSLTYRRFNDLKKAEAQAREAQIEASLERVRAKAMSMQNSDELDEVLSVLCEQFDVSGILPMSTHMTVFNFDNNTFTFRETGKYGDRSFGEQTVDLDAMDTWKETVDKWKADKATAVNKLHFPKETLPEVWEVFHESFASMPEESRITPDDYPDGIYHTAGKHPFGYIGMNQIRPATGEEEEIVIKFANEFGRAYQRFLDLQKAEAQTREAKIETALEKVRSRTMGMQRSDELAEVANVLFAEMNDLVHNLWTCGFVLCEKGREEDEWWLSLEDGFSRGFFLPNVNDYAHTTLYEGWLEGDSFRTVQLDGDKLQEHYDWLMQIPVAKNVFDDLEAAGMQRPEWQKLHAAYFSKGYLVIITREPCPEEEIFKRFAKVFDQTYTRFLDLKKAEAQAREAKIETALEKVRSRTMGMQSSDELPEVANLLFLEVQALDIPAWSCGYCISEEDRRSSICIMSSEGTLQKPFLLPHHGEVSFEEWDDFVQGDQTFFTQELGGKAIESHYGFMKSLPQLTSIFREIEDAGLSLPTYQINHLCKFTHGFLLFITYEPVPEAHDIFKRFTRVFDQTYTRFLDLKKAEKQAREAQIENALEKVRSRSLAMQHPDELTEVVQLLREEMGALGVEELETSSIYIHDESSGLTECWFTIKNTDDPGKAVTDQMTIDLQDTWVGREMKKFYRSQAKQISIVMQGQNRVEWIRYCEEKSDLFGTSEFYGETIPERTYHLYKFSNGFLGAASPGNISEESWDLLKRATLVFSFAYTRFSDLQIAEASARASIRQASLDRVRADIASMRSAEDLSRVIPLIWNELKTLDIPFIRCGVFIIHEEEEEIEVYLSKPDGTSLAVMHLSFGSSDLVNQTVDAWRNGSVYIQHWTQKEFLDWGGSMMEQGQIPDLETYQGAEEAPESLHLHFIPFNQGMLYVGSTGPLSEEEIDLAASLAKAFSIAYARYEDFVKLEKAKAGIEDALAELKATQSQLVQQEKLASLGQLTAGIAHEIKNPLNFVNNFSELSVELIEEAREEIKEINSKFKIQNLELSDLLNDIETNLKTIHKHGSRADSIVKSMLEHSRGGDGTMEPTNLNGLVKEFVNLSFHGMRAGKDPINVDIEMELDENVGNVPLIAEDFSRVIINLCNNAFDAMRSLGAERSAHGKEYKPKLTIRSKKTDDAIALEIEDNGPGISDKIKDKILQPFFTTKKGTEGTGLGLSITNDIIKAHGGELSVNSTSESGSIFIITLKP